MLHRIDPAIPDMIAEIFLVADVVFPEALLPNGCFVA